MRSYYYVGLDVHKRTVSYCIKEADGTVVEQGTIRARLRELTDWALEVGDPPPPDLT